MAIENITEAQKVNLVKLYLAYFNRAPETQGLDYHVAQFLADLNAGLSEEQAFAKRADSFYQAAIDVPAWSGYSVSMTAAEFVAKMYDNVLLRPGAGGDAPTADEIGYWVEQLESGAVTRGGMITSFLNAVPHLIEYGTPEENAIATQVKAVLDARLEVALEFVKPEHSGALTGQDAFTAGKNVLVGVVDADSAAARIAALDAAANTYTLTEGVDVWTANVFDAPRGWTPGGTDQVNTLNDDDTLTGSGVNPTLNFTFVQDSDIASMVITPTLNGIETVNVQFASQQGVALLDAQDSTGIENVNLSRIAFGNTQAGVRNLGAEATNLSINNSNAPAARVDLTYLNSALTGADDEVNLKLNNVTAGTVIVGPENWTPGVGVETLNLESTGAANRVNTLQVEDLETLIISGDQALTLGSESPTVHAVSGQVEATRYGAGLDAVAGSLDTIDASALETGLSINLGGEVVANQDGTSGKAVDFDFTGTAHDDTVRLLNGLNKGDTFDLGDGNDTVALFQNAAAGALNGVESVELRSGHDAGFAADTINFDASIAPDLEGIVIRNEGQRFNAGTNRWESKAESGTFNLTQLTAEVAENITVLHGTTGNNGAAGTVINVALATDTANDTVGVTIADDININPRSNFVLLTSKVENIVINDQDTESNTVLLATSAGVGPQNTSIDQITRSIVVTGEDQAGNFLNLDSATPFGTNLLQLDVTGKAADGTGITDVAAVAAVAAARFIGETVDASAYTGDLIVRVAENLAVPTGAQTILGGSGDDHIIFDALNNTTAGLSISDTVNGGDGHDTLYLDGHGKIVNISASEWTNVSSIEEVHLVGNGQPDITGTPGANDAYSKNAYNLTLTNDFIAANGEEVAGGRRIIITNDNGKAGSANDGVTIDARSLNAQSNFQYNGRSGNAGVDTADRFILSDANINGLALIDGGARLVGGAPSNAANNDILEVRNSAVVTIGDLAGIKNVSNIELTNDQAAGQTFVLQLDNAAIDRLVNDSKAADAANPEVLNIGVFNNPLLNAAVSTLNLDLTQVTETYLGVNVTGGAGAQVITITGGTGATVSGGAGADTLVGGAGDDVLNGDNGADIITGGAGADTLTGGNQADTFVYTAASDSTAAAMDVITDFVSGTDVINLDALFAGGPAAPAAVTAAVAALNGTAAEFGGNEIAFFDDGTDTTVYVDVNGDGAFNAGDSVIQLAGVSGVVLAATDFVI